MHEGVNVVIHFRQTPSMKTAHGGGAEKGKGRERKEEQDSERRENISKY